MIQSDHEEFGRKILSELVNSVKTFGGGSKSRTYGEIAESVDYPRPHTGNLFAKNIGVTLGTMGHMLDNIKIPNWDGRIPFIQSLVVAKKNGLPSKGLHEFEKDYDLYDTGEKRTFVSNEYAKIFEFGNRWSLVLKELGITEVTSTESRTTSGNRKLYNPFGSEGSPEHRNLKEYVRTHGGLFGYQGTQEGINEYPLKSGDLIDVVFRDDNGFVALEVKSVRSGYDDMERGIYQCIKYRAVLEAQEKAVKGKRRKVTCSLVTENELPKYLARTAAGLEVRAFVKKVN